MGEPMIIEIHRPELQALIHERMRTGAFASVEDALLEAIPGTPVFIRECFR